MKKVFRELQPREPAPLRVKFDKPWNDAAAKKIGLFTVATWSLRLMRIKMIPTKETVQLLRIAEDRKDGGAEELFESWLNEREHSNELRDSR